MQENVVKFERKKGEEANLESLLNTISTIEDNISKLAKEVNGDLPQDTQYGITRPVPPSTTNEGKSAFKRKFSSNPSGAENYIIGDFRKQLDMWTDERLKKSEVLTKHSMWLNNFKQQIAQPLVINPKNKLAEMQGPIQINLQKDQQLAIYINGKQ